MVDRADTPLSLETRLSRLETIVAALEREDLELEEALRLFEEGIAHLRQAKEVLGRTELRIERLLEGPDGPILEPVERGEE